MATNIFISFDHEDQRQVAGFRLIKSSTKHQLDFRDHSLKQPVSDRSGSPIVYPPSDERSRPVREEIKRKFQNASKLIVLIGDKTHESEWVDWEIKTFYNMKYSLSGEHTWKRIRGMRLKYCDDAKMAPALADRSTQILSWDPDAMSKWLDQDPDA